MRRRRSIAHGAILTPRTDKVALTGSLSGPDRRQIASELQQISSAIALPKQHLGGMGGLGYP